MKNCINYWFCFHSIKFKMTKIIKCKRNLILVMLEIMKADIEWETKIVNMILKRSNREHQYWVHNILHSNGLSSKGLITGVLR